MTCQLTSEWWVIDPIKVFKFLQVLADTAWRTMKFSFLGNGTFFLSSQRHEGTTIFGEYLQRAHCGSWNRRIYNPWSWLLGKMGKGWSPTFECHTDCDVSTWTLQDTCIRQKKNPFLFHSPKKSNYMVLYKHFIFNFIARFSMQQ